MAEEEEVTVESRENNATNEVEETCPLIEIDGQTADVIGDKKDAGKVSCEGVVVKEHQDEKVEKQKIIRSRKRIRKSTVIGRSAGKLDLKRVKEDLKEHNNGEDVVSNIDNDKSNVAHGNKGNQNVGVDVENRGEKVQVITEKDMGESSKKKRKTLKQKNRSDPLVEGSLVKVASESGGKSGRSNKKKGMLKPGTKGIIFMCSSNTKTDCYRYMVLGLPAGKRDMVENISKGMVLFLYDVDQKLLNGIYKAAAHGGYNIEPEAFDSKFPAQILEGCLPLGEEKFREVIKENYYSKSKFDCQLNSEQVENLCNLFRASVDDVKHERPGRRSARGPPKVVRAKLKAAPAPFKAESRKVMRPPWRKAHPDRPLLRNEVAPWPRRPVRLPQSSVSSHTYERSSNREVLRGEPSVDHHEIYRHQQLEARDTYSDPYLEPRDVYRQEQLLAPRDFHRVEQPQLHSRDVYTAEKPSLQLQPRDLHRPYPVLERRNYDLEPLTERRDYDLDPLLERRDSYRRQGSLLDNQDLYISDLVLERQNLQRLNLEPRHSSSLLPREDRSAFSGGVYTTAQPLGASMVPESLAVGLPSVYPPYAEAELRYYSHRPVYRL